MNIDNAIDTLNKFKKIAKKMGNECELVGFSDETITFQVRLAKKDESCRRIIGFSDTES